jgi:hypothetical protein
MAGTTITSKRCLFCGKTHLIEVDAAAFSRWQGGANVQVAFPEMAPEDREVLISGTCPACWDTYMGGEEE